MFYYYKVKDVHDTPLTGDKNDNFTLDTDEDNFKMETKIKIVLKEKPFKVKFESQYWSTGINKIDEQEVKKGQKATAPTGFEKDTTESTDASGKTYIFKGWSLDETNEYNFEIPVTKDLTLKAIWEEFYTVTVKANDGKGADITTKVESGKTYILPSNNAFEAPSGKEFAGWKVGTETKAPGAQITITADTEILAEWKYKSTTPPTPVPPTSGPTPFPPIPYPNIDRHDLVDIEDLIVNYGSDRRDWTAVKTSESIDSVQKSETKTDTKVEIKETKLSEYILTIGSKTYKDNFGKEYTFEIAPIIENDRTMLPLRVVAEMLGAKVDRDKETRTATFTKGNLVAKIQIDGNKIVLNDGKTIEIDSKPHKH